MGAEQKMNRVNFYAGADMDRVSPLRRDGDWITDQLASPEARVLPVWREKNFVSFLDQGAESFEIAWLTVGDASALANGGDPFVLLGEKNGIPYFAIDLSHLDEPEAAALHGTFVGLRDVGGALGGASSGGESPCFASAASSTAQLASSLPPSPTVG